MKKRGPLLAAFCIPLLITLIICVNREIYPFGDQCMLHIDMYHQYCPFFTELMEKLNGRQSVLFVEHRAGSGFCIPVCVLPCQPVKLAFDSVAEGICD